MRPPDRVILSCEHGGNGVPREYAPLFRGKKALLRSHRGWDPGTLELGRYLRRRFGWPLFAATTTRLLVELNRSGKIFSEITRRLPEEQKERLLERHWRPHRERVEAEVRRGGRVLHLALHSFTPVFAGRVRDVDVGILYDPARPREAAFARAWQRALLARRKDLRVRLNRPYRGWTDGLTTHLRTRFPDRRYAGIELEVSQRFPLGAAASWRSLMSALASSLEEAAHLPD